MSPHSMIPVPQAIRCVLLHTALVMRRQIDSDYVSLSADDGSCVDRAAWEDVVMPPPGYPPYPLSVMDGYAIQLPQDIPQQVSIRLPIISAVYAGDSDLLDAVASGRFGAIYVTTGAVLPHFCDTVIPVEQVSVLDDHISIPTPILQQYAHSQRSMWIRKVGCDVPAGTVVLHKGQTVESAHLGLLLQCGLSRVKVRPRPIVGILSTGNELRSYADDLHMQTTTRTIPDVNRPILKSILDSFHSCTTVDLGIVPDDPLQIQQVLDQAIDACDVVITTGGISMGDKDLVQQTLLQLGCRLHFGRLHMKPGKPTTFLTCDRLNKMGHTKTCLIFALPGNPVSAFVCAQLLVRPCLDLLHRGTKVSSNGSIHDIVRNAFLHEEVFVTINQPIKLDLERPEYHRIQLESYLDSQSLQNITRATSTGIQQSSRLLSLVEADALLVLPHLQGKNRVEAGEVLPALLLHPSLGKYRVQNSLHIRSAKLTVNIIQFIYAHTEQYNHITLPTFDSDESINQRTFHSLGGQDHVYMLETCHATSIDEVQRLIHHPKSDCLDVLVIVGIRLPFLINLQLSSLLKALLKNVSDTTALVMRKAISSMDPLGALFDPIFGYYEDDCKSMQIISIPETGIEPALDSVTKLLKHTLFLSRGYR